MTKNRNRYSVDGTCFIISQILYDMINQSLYEINRILRTQQIELNNCFVCVCVCACVFVCAIIT